MLKPSLKISVAVEDQDPHWYWSTGSRHALGMRIRMAKWPTKIEKVKIFHFLKRWMFSFEDWRLLLSLRLPLWRPRNKWIATFYQKIFFPAVNFLDFWSSKHWNRNRIRIDLKWTRCVASFKWCIIQEYFIVLPPDCPEAFWWSLLPHVLYWKNTRLTFWWIGHIFIWFQEIIFVWIRIRNSYDSDLDPDSPDPDSDPFPARPRSRSRIQDARSRIQEPRSQKRHLNKKICSNETSGWEQYLYCRALYILGGFPHTLLWWIFATIRYTDYCSHNYAHFTNI